ncbi:MAG: bifunctional biotin--[acetyl-CoA-carboxylase] synthetase/biotin operon repressor, partial [Candidatus Eisenbacteria bacterium]|nr:bifunctional biotin--[acetyl-CoA-carboxylase] synthetase/biotin operon repressor [Candidatus Eisenbacteria bacterium]
TGVAHDLDRDGALILRLADGSDVTALAGDVEPAAR